MDSLNSLPMPAEKFLILTDPLTRSPSFLEKTRKFVSKESQKIVQPVIIKETLSTVSTKLSNTWSQIKSKAKRLYSNDYNYEKTSSIRGIPLSSSANEDLLFYSSNRSHEEIEDIVSETSQSSSGSITSSLKDFQDEFAEKIRKLNADLIEKNYIQEFIDCFKR